MLKSSLSELDRNMGEWGIRPITTAHRKFHDIAKKNVISCFEKEEDDRYKSPLEDRLLELSENSFPKDDAVEAIKTVLRHELLDTKSFYSIAHDKLQMNFNPYYHRVDKWTGRISYETRREFDSFSKRELDPLFRFTEERLSEANYFHYCWSDNDSLAGTALEGVICCYVVHNMACASCLSKGGLRWNGGRDKASSWADIVCIRCESTYEIKTKKNPQAVEKGFSYNSFRGGSFRLFHKYPPKGQRFLVMASRTASPDLKNNWTYPVWIAKIDYIIPRLCEESFIDYLDGRMTIKSDIKVKLPHLKKKWCNVPVCRADFSALARLIFNARYGRGKWESLGKTEENVSKTEELESDSSTAEPSKNNQGNEKTTLENVDELKEALDALKVADNEEGSDDDWETLYDA